MYSQQYLLLELILNNVMHFLLSLVTGNSQGGLERAYEALGITLARNGEPRLPQFGEKYPTILKCITI